MTDEYVQGLDALLAELKDLAPNVEKNALRTSMFRAATFLKEKLAEAAPMSDGYPPKGGRMKQYPPGTLKKSFKAKRRKGSKFEASAGVTGAFYAKWVELGHTLKSHGKKDQRQIIGHVPPNPFIFRTFEANQDQLVEIARNEMVIAIEKIVGKLRAKMPKGG